MQTSDINSRRLSVNNTAVTHSVPVNGRRGWSNDYAECRQQWDNRDKPVDDVSGVQVLQCRHYLGRVETRAVLVKAYQSLDVKHKVSAVQILHHKIQVTLHTTRHTQTTNIDTISLSLSLSLSLSIYLSIYLYFFLSFTLSYSYLWGELIRESAESVRHTEVLRITAISHIQA